MPSRQQDKRSLRRRIRQRRRALSPVAQRQAAAALRRHIVRFHALACADRIGAYLPTDGEIDPCPALIELMRRGRCCLLPVIMPGRRPRIRFARVTPNTRLVVNRLGILEPDLPPRQWLDPRQLDVIFLPLVAFDKWGNRLGRGGAFYDASLAAMRQRRHLKRPRLIGLAHECQQVVHLATDSWDIPLDGVMTDRRFVPAIR